MKCVYCQNYSISQQQHGREITLERLGEIFLELQGQGAHNINLVNPTHYAVQIAEVLKDSHALHIPVVYNSNGYEGDCVLKNMEGTVDIYLPDLKYMDPETVAKYSGAPNYFEVAQRSILEMYRQVGGATFDSSGLLKKGLVIRHLILPGHASQSIRILDWIKANLPGDILVSLMSQYVPLYKAADFPEINRRIIRREYERVVSHFLKLDFENGYVQERESAEEEYIPDFDLEGI